MSKISDLSDTLIAQGIPIISVRTVLTDDGKRFEVDYEPSATPQQMATGNFLAASVNFDAPEIKANGAYLLEIIAANITASAAAFVIAQRLAAVGNFAARQAYWNGVKDSLDAVQQSIIVGAATESGITGIT